MQDCEANGQAKEDERRQNMGNTYADIPVADATLASDSAAKRLTGDERRREILDAVRTVSS